MFGRAHSMCGRPAERPSTSEGQAGDASRSRVTARIQSAGCEPRVHPRSPALLAKEPVRAVGVVTRVICAEQFFAIVSRA